MPLETAKGFVLGVALFAAWLWLLSIHWIFFPLTIAAYIALSWYEIRVENRKAQREDRHV